MDLKSWLKRKKSGGSTPKRPARKPDVTDLLLTGRLEEAEELLEKKLAAQPGDLHAMRQLAELQFKTGRQPQGVETFLKIADRFSQEGFLDKAVAVLSRAARLAPQEESLKRRMKALERKKRLAYKRSLVISGLKRAGADGSGASALEIERLWENLVVSPLVDSLGQEELRRLFSACEVVKVSEGQILTKEGQQLEEIYLLAQGGLEAVATTRSGAETVIREFSPGQLLGDRALLEHLPWPATIRAQSEGTILRLTRSGLAAAMQGSSDPRVILAALRLERNDQAVASAVSGLKGGKG
jgi:hypothetical protein